MAQQRGQFTGATMGNYTGWWLIGTAIFELALAGFFLFMASTNPIISGGMNLTAMILGGVGLIMLIFGVRSVVSARTTSTLLQTGLDAKGTVTGLTQTGLYLNEQPQVKIHLNVSAPGIAPYDTVHTEFVPMILLASIQIGNTLNLKVDGANHDHVAIVW